MIEVYNVMLKKKNARPYMSTRGASVGVRPPKKPRGSIPFGLFLCTNPDIRNHKTSPQTGVLLKEGGEAPFTPSLDKHPSADKPPTRRQAPRQECY